MKTRRGTFYYIQVGERFYAGTRPIMRKAERTVVDEERLKKIRERVPKYQLNRNGQYGRFLMRGTDRRYKQATGSWTTTPTKKELIEVPSNQYVDDWTDDVTKAKPFRIHSKALAKADDLAKSLSLNEVKPKVLLFEGDRT